MRKIITLLFFSGILSSAIAQDCKVAMNSTGFQTVFTQIATQQGDELRFSKAITMLNGNCYAAAQVKTIAQIFADENYKLDYCKLSYNYIVDKENYFEVFDAFTKFSSAIRLYDYLYSVNAVINVNTATNGTNYTNTSNNSTTNYTPVFHNLNYPTYLNYKGKTGCPGPAIGDNDFLTLATDVNKQPTDESKYTAAIFASESKCLNMAQVMKLAMLITSESVRYKLLTQTFHRVYDMENYEYAKVVLTSAQFQNDWTAYCKVYLTPPPPVCMVSDADFKSVMESVKNQRFSDEKISTFKLAGKDRCFNVNQVKEVSKQFTFGSEKLEVFKFAYAKCTNRQDYYKLMDELTFSSEKDELKKFMESNK